MTTENTPDNVTELPTKKRATRQKVKAGAAIGLGLFAALLIIDDGVKRLKNRKTETPVEDSPES